MRSLSSVLLSPAAELFVDVASQRVRVFCDFCGFLCIMQLSLLCASTHGFLLLPCDGFSRNGVFKNLTAVFWGVRVYFELTFLRPD